MQVHSKTPDGEQPWLPSSHEAGRLLLSTHDTLVQRRRTEIYERSLIIHGRTINDLQVLAAGDTVVSDLEAFAFDVPIWAYERDYAKLQDYFEATPLGNKLIEIRPRAREDDIATRQTDVRARLGASPFRQQLAELADEMHGLVELSPEPGVYELMTRFDRTSEAGRQIAAVLGEKELLRISDRDDEGIVEVIIQDESDNEASKYLHTDSARKLLESLDAAGIHLTEEAKRELAIESDHRYGNAYAWISREIVKEIAGYSSHLMGDSGSELPEYTDDAGANLLIDALRQVRLRDDGPWPSDIPVTKQYVKLRDKGCKDVEVYFSQSATIPGKLTTVTAGEKRFWHKTHGGHTYINLDPVVYNGIELPPGYVFKQAEDGGYALLRATGFAFDKPTADVLFGTPMTESYEVPEEEAAMRAAFDAFAAERNAASI